MTEKKNTNRLMLPAAKPLPQHATLKLTIPAGLHAALVHYQDAYREMNQAELSMDDIGEYILRQHLRRDKAFAAWATTHGIKLEI